MLDDGLQAPWPSDVLPAVKRFRLGDLVERPPIVFAADPTRPLWAPASGRIEGAGVVELAAADQPSYGIIVSQTCDLHDRTESQPFFEISPVYDVPPDTKGKLYLHKLTGPALPAGTWVADLRLTVPLEKGLLVDREPIRGFVDEQGEIDFAHRLGRRRDRAALADSINDVLFTEFKRRARNNNRAYKKVKEQLHAIMLAVAQGNRLEPVAVRVYFYSRSGPLDAPAEAFLEAWWDNAFKAAGAHDPSLNLLANVYRDGSCADVAMYDDLIPLGWLA
jgi:hypothetical protein